MKKRIETFRKRLVEGEALVGTFMKTPSPVIGEILGLTDLDVITLDTEHAPFGRTELDLCIAVLRAADMPSLVRVSDESTTSIRNALDSGATGIVVPHVTTAEQAESVVKATRFGEGGRGYAGSPRAAGYTTRSMSDHLHDSNEQTAVIVQIEDLAALDNVPQIAAVDGVDCVFVGRVDLAVAMQKSVSDRKVVAIVHDICSAGKSTGTTVGMFTPNLDELPEWQAAGASLFLLGSEQSMILAGADALAQSIR